jgi:hypothetical protein
MRVLAALAETMFAKGRALPEEPPVREAPQPAIRNRLVDALIHRRADRELRSLMQRHQARTEAVLISTHVDNAVAFAQFFGEPDTYPQVIADYLDATELRPAFTPAVYAFALERLSRDQFPAGALTGRSPAQLGTPATAAANESA